jgi:hypothetical protein
LFKADLIIVQLSYKTSHSLFLTIEGTVFQIHIGYIKFGIFIFDKSSFVSKSDNNINTSVVFKTCFNQFILETKLVFHQFRLFVFTVFKYSKNTFLSNVGGIKKSNLSENKINQN